MAILDGPFWMVVLDGLRPGPDHSRSHRIGQSTPLQIAKIGVGGGKEPEITRMLVSAEHHETGCIDLITRRSQVQILPPPPRSRRSGSVFRGRPSALVVE